MSYDGKATSNKAVRLIPRLLSGLGLIDEERGTKSVELAWPVMITGILRVTLRLADFLMVGLVAGSVGIAALGFSFQFYFIGFGIALAISSGTISLVSQHFGASEYSEANFVIKQSTWLALIISIPLIAITLIYSEQMLGVLGASSEVIETGAPYLRALMVGVFFRFFSMVASRGFAGVGDTVTPMRVRIFGVPMNIFLNWVLIFGIGPFPNLGVLGAGIGTAVTNFSIAMVFAVLLLSKRYRVSFPLAGKQWDSKVVRKIFKVSLPLLVMRMARVGSRFPLLWILALLGTSTVAAFQVGRRVVMFAMMPAWGFATSASTLVGQSLGAGKEREAELFGWDTLKTAITIMVSISVVIAIFAKPLAGLFVRESQAIALSTNFIRIYSIGVIGFAIDRVMRGSLRGAGDTRWPMYGIILAMYVWMLPVSYILGIILGLGVHGVFLGLLGGLFIPSAVNIFRFRSGKWKKISREIHGRPQPKG